MKESDFSILLDKNNLASGIFFTLIFNAGMLFFMQQQVKRALRYKVRLIEKGLSGKGAVRLCHFD
ncbi:MAG: hypothetical protein HY231_11240 [Acidobacteria bacterium]|nr:hypothetical protein [Acidobacteriota bacterium]